MSGNDEKEVTEVWECQKCFPKFNSRDRHWNLKGDDDRLLGWLLWPSATYYREKYGGPLLWRNRGQQSLEERGSKSIFYAYCPFCGSLLTGEELVKLRKLVDRLYMAGGYIIV